MNVDDDRHRTTADEKLDEALKGTFPASDAFYVAPSGADLAHNQHLLDSYPKRL